jgi:hypothetical protein
MFLSNDLTQQINKKLLVIVPVTAKKVKIQKSNSFPNINKIAKAGIATQPNGISIPLINAPKYPYDFKEKMYC